ncbi:MAG TPA: ATP-binding protein, partial [Pseudonocardiaceae bacterium]
MRSVDSGLTESSHTAARLVWRCLVPLVTGEAGVTDPVVHTFVGRQAELDRLSQCAVAARAGRPSLALVLGGPGIGKTTFVEYAVAGLSEFTVLRARGARAELDCPFGVFSQLLAGLPSGLLAESSLLHGTIPVAAAPTMIGVQALAVIER